MFGIDDNQDAPSQPGTQAANGDANQSETDLFEIKKQALQSLTPLVGRLDQEPEEKFKTTMMLIQASDNPTLIKLAYEAAKKISDESIRAQALIDIINEINYFTHQKS